MAFDEATGTDIAFNARGDALPSGMREALQDVQTNGDRIVTLASEYSGLLAQLQESDFVREMRRLSNSIINDRP
ncbi:MAG: hypothetical protein AAGL49_04265 [Pseudomonadota bacterium]